MKKLKLTGLVLLLSNILISCSSPPTAEDLNVTKTVFSEYKTYTKINDSLKISPTHGGKFVFTQINSTGIDSYRNKKYPYPDGTIAVKEAHDANDPASRIDTLYVMKKTSGFDKDNGDWYYSVMDSSGKAKMAGVKIQMCISCHQASKDKDYIIGF